MHITITKTTIKFSELEKGNIFEHDSILYVKLFSTLREVWMETGVVGNAINILTGELGYFYPDNEVVLAHLKK